MNKKIKVTPELIAKLKPYWKKIQESKLQYLQAVDSQEILMAQEVNIDLGFFWVDGEVVGIGTPNKWPRKMRLILEEELE